MKILIIGPGAGDSFYCGNCFRDSLQASALIKAGNDVTILPQYLPMHHATEGVPIFFPAVSYYIEQAMFRKGNIPKWLSKSNKRCFRNRYAYRFYQSTEGGACKENRKANLLKKGWYNYYTPRYNDSKLCGSVREW